MLRTILPIVLVASTTFHFMRPAAAARELEFLIRSGDTIDGLTIQELYVDDSPPPIINDAREVLFTAQHDTGIDLFTLEREVSPPLFRTGASIYTDMNNLGQIAVLVDELVNGQPGTALFVDGSLVDLTALSSETVRINNRGQIVYHGEDEYIAIGLDLRIDHGSDEFFFNDRGSIAYQRWGNEGPVSIVDDQFDSTLPGSLWGFNNSNNRLVLTENWNGRSQDTTLSLDDQVVATTGDHLDGRQIEEVCEGKLNDFGDTLFTATSQFGASCGPVNLITGELTAKSLFLDGRAILTGSEEGPGNLVMNNFASIDFNNRRDALFLAALADGSRALMISYGPSLDFDSNDSLDANDVDQLVQHIAIGGDDLTFDLGEDGIVDASDLERWLWNAGIENLDSRQPYMSGDADLDGDVDPSDLNALAINWLRVDNPGWSHGDFNADGKVDQADLNEIGINWLSGRVAQAVPEPGAFSVTAMLLVLLLWWGDPRMASG